MTETLSKRLRDYVIERDGACVYCHTQEPVEVHHIRPQSDGGRDDIQNLVTLCRDHHGAVHAFGDADRFPPEILDQHDVPKEIPDIRGFDVYTTMVMDFIVNERNDYCEPWGRVNPKFVTDRTGIRRQYVSRALKNLGTAGWVKKVATGLYDLVDDPRDE